MDLGGEILRSVAEPSGPQVGGDPAATAGDRQESAVLLRVPGDVEPVRGECVVERGPVAVTLGIGQGAVDVEDDGPQLRRLYDRAESSYPADDLLTPLTPTPPTDRVR